MFHYIGQGVNYVISIVLWMIERVVTRMVYLVFALLSSEVLLKIAKQIFNEKLIGTYYYLPEEEWIGWSIVWEGAAILIVLVFVALVAGFLGDILETIMDSLQRKQDKKLEIDNVKIGKVLFCIWVL